MFVLLHQFSVARYEWPCVTPSLRVQTVRGVSFSGSSLTRAVPVANYPGVQQGLEVGGVGSWYDIQRCAPESYSISRSTCSGKL